jgi:hypothetical protein
MNKLIAILLLTCFCSYAFAADPTFEPYLTIDEIQEEGSLMTLGDGSQWNILDENFLWKLTALAITQETNVSHWTAGDKMEIRYPLWGNHFEFYLEAYNITKNETAFVTLSAPPTVDFPECLWVADYDEVSRIITDNHETKWQLTRYNFHGPVVTKTVFGGYVPTEKTWSVGDPLTCIRGAENLLWNHNTNEMPSAYAAEISIGDVFDMGVKAGLIKLDAE